MATIDLNALRKFQDMWGPVMSTIPAVLEMAEQRADIERAIAAYRAEAELAKTQAAAVKAQLADELAASRADIAKSKAQQVKWNTDLEAMRASAAQERATLEKQNAAAAAAAAQKVAELESKIVGLSGTYATKEADARAAHAKTLTSLQVEADNLEATRVKAEKALKLLRAQLGG